MPIDLDKILVPVDYSDGSQRAVEYAVALAGKVGATVHLLHVGVLPVDYWPLETWLWGEKPPEHSLEDELRNASQKAFGQFLDRLADEVRAGVTDSRMEVGVPHDVIVEVAKDYDLIVMGTHGRTGGKRVLLGSVAERVLRHAPIPVLTVKG